MACVNWFDGIKADLEKRRPHYLSDWTDIWSQKVLSSTLFIFFTSIAPAITFSLFVTESTNDELGAIEILLSTAITGVIFSVFGGQPLVILGVTGPVAILTASIYTLSKTWGLKFIPFYAWAQIWAGIIQIVLACSNSCSLLKYVTQFSCETFGVLIALIYLYTGLEGMAKMLKKDEYTFPCGLLQFIIAIGTALTSSWLTHARHWHIFTEDVRSIISDYGATVSIVLWSAVPYLASDRLSSVDHVPTLYVPLKFATTSGRSWLVNFGDIPAWGVFAAVFPGMIIALLFFFDHNVSSIIAQHRDYGLRKGTAFHWDYFVVGVCTIITGILGIPPTNGLIPQAPLHVKSVIVKRRVMTADGQPTSAFEIERIYEQRVTNLMQSVLTGLGMIRPFSEALRAIPTAVLYGLFLFLGLQSFEENEFPARVALFFTDPVLLRAASLRHSSSHGSISTSMMHLLKTLSTQTIWRFTAIQCFMCALIFGITFTPAEVIFPVLIGLLVVLRQYGLPCWFSVEELDILDKAVLSDEEQYALAHPRISGGADRSGGMIGRQSIEPTETQTFPLGTSTASALDASSASSTSSSGLLTDEVDADGRNNDVAIEIEMHNL